MLALVRVFIFFIYVPVFLCLLSLLFFCIFFCTTYTLKLFYLVISAYTFVICSLKINQSLPSTAVFFHGTYRGEQSESVVPPNTSAKTGEPSRMRVTIINNRSECVNCLEPKAKFRSYCMWG